jgi:uncharacterized YigZ family protein
MRSIARNGEHQLEIQRSRFICSLARVTTAGDAADFIASVRKQHWSATHNCSAFRVGPNGQEQRSNDDGEPAGTAGVPMLEVLVRRELTDTAAVVTRYYGGIKLGTGGLVRAYGGSVAAALDAVGTVRRAPHARIDVTSDHADAGRLENDLRGAGHLITAIDYATRVRFTVLIPADTTEATARFSHWLAERTNGRAAARYRDELLIDVLDQ